MRRESDRIGASVGGAGRRRSIRSRLAAAMLAIALVPAVGALPMPSAEAMVVADYPSWADVKKAQQDAAAAKAAVTRIRALLTQLEEQVAQTRAVADEKGAIYADAQAAYDEKAYETQQLQLQADAEKQKADEAKRSAAQFIASLAKDGDTTVATLFAEGGDVDELLGWLGASKKYGETNAAVFERAVQLQRSAEALQEQAERAQGILAQLKAEAEAAFEAAKAAAIQAQAAYDEQAENKTRLEAQLVALEEKKEVTEEEYQEGLRAQWGNNAAGAVSPSGWANPTNGYISSHFGLRYHPIYEVWKLHSGTDVAGGGFNAPIYAAHGGTVIYAGPYSDLGNYIKIDHGNGIVTGYAHINYGGIMVNIGQSVSPGQQIARVGSTGGSTGPHLHFMVYRNGVLTDPVPFLRGQGVTLGG